MREKYFSFHQSSLISAGAVRAGGGGGGGGGRCKALNRFDPQQRSIESWRERRYYNKISQEFLYERSIFYGACLYGAEWSRKIVGIITYGQTQNRS